MIDVLKAVLIGAAIISGIFAVSFLIMFLFPIIVFVTIAFCVWIVIKLLKPDKDDDEDLSGF